MGSTGYFRHHTMLVHESVKMAEQRSSADEIRALWQSGGWYTPPAGDGSAQLYEADFLPVMQGARRRRTRSRLLR